ncbi:MAG: T9SS type A sorting domain-containing protein [Bacteroidales bacterium]|nr:T9SS type A sorting domain-containing protein [Bacteroidales bacterium]
MKRTLLIHIIAMQMIHLICHCQVSPVAEVVVMTGETHQTMDGFGSSIAFYDDLLVVNPNKEEIYNLIFNDLGLDILRLRNIFSGDTTGNFAQAASEIVSKMFEYSPSTPRIMMSSWGPPAEYKSNNSTMNGGTLKMVNDHYIYGAFAQWWADALKSYRKAGVEPDYISLQNEPTYTATWESCRFDPSENATYAGYDQALDSVHFALQQVGLNTKLLAAEVHGIGYNTFQNYAESFNQDVVDAYCYHLYHGDNGSMNTNPDAFNDNLSAIAETYPDKPVWQTEYDRGDWFQTAWLIHNCLVNGNVSGYFWWALTWPAGGKALIEYDNTNYTVSDYYWAFRQYSKFIYRGWKRVTTESNDDYIRVSAFINSENSKLSIVVLNISETTAKEVGFEIRNFSVSNGLAVRTTETMKGEEISDDVTIMQVLEYPPRSITTLEFNGSVNSIYGISADHNGSELLENYPNPFSSATTISYSLEKLSPVCLTIYNLHGQKIQTLENSFKNAGKHSVVWDITDKNMMVPPGIYICRLKVGDNSIQKKITVVK